MGGKERWGGTCTLNLVKNERSRGGVPCQKKPNDPGPTRRERHGEKKKKKIPGVCYRMIPARRKAQERKKSKRGKPPHHGGERGKRGGKKNKESRTGWVIRERDAGKGVNPRGGDNARGVRRIVGMLLWVGGGQGENPNHLSGIHASGGGQSLGIDVVSGGKRRLHVNFGGGGTRTKNCRQSNR